MKTLLLGANGQLGRTFLSHGGLAARGVVTAATRDGRLVDNGQGAMADLSVPETLAALLDAERPEVIVNAAAYTAVDRAEQEEAVATRVNGEAVGMLARWAKAHGALLVNYSTDYVFAGDARSPYREDAATEPAGAYGRSKRAGEEALFASGAPHFNFRTAWVYAPVGHNFLRTMLRLAAEREELRVVADQIGAPTPARWIADVTAGVTTSSPASSGLGGVFNLVAAGRCSWYDFASAIVEGAAARELIARAPRVVPIATADFPTRARRPAWSVLDGARLEAAFGLQLPDWRAGLDQVLDELAAAGPA